MQSEIDGETVAYVRRSTFKQENEHQNEEIRRWLDNHDVDVTDVDFLSDTASGSSENRDGLNELLKRVRNDEVDHVVVWELSRIARRGSIAQEFFDACEDHGVTVHVTDGRVNEITPDGDGRFVADIFAAVYAEERRTLIRRTRLGVQRAKDNDKWVGKPPLGFTTDEDGYLVPNIGFNEELDNFWAVQQAIEDVHENNASYRSVAQELEASRQSISDIYRDEEKRQRYLEFTSDDKRVDNALNVIREETDD